MNQFNISRIQNEVKRIMLYLPGMVGKSIVEFSMDAFRQQRWFDEGIEEWKARKSDEAAAAKKGKSIAKDDLGRFKGRFLLFKTGRLRRSIRIIRTTPDSVTVGSDVPYAKIHNEGFDGPESVKAHTRRLFSTGKAPATNLKTGKVSMRKFKLNTGSTDVKSFTRNMKMPKRQFLGPSRQLETILKMQIEKELAKAFKQ